MTKRAKKQPTFGTRRLSVRPWRESDLQAMHELYSDAGNLHYWNEPAFTRLAQTRRVLRWHVVYRPQRYATWAVEEKKSRRVVGMVNYHRRFLLARKLGFRKEGGPIRDRWRVNEDWRSVLIYGLIAGEET